MQIEVKFNRITKGLIIAVAAIVFAMGMSLTVNPNVVTAWNVFAIILGGASLATGVITIIFTIVAYLEKQKD